MTPIFCQVRHDPPNSYGDCIRACIASMLDMQAREVPHFYEDNCEGEEGARRIREFLFGIGLRMVHFAYDGSSKLAEVLEGWEYMNPGIPAILVASSDSADHAVIMQNGRIEHNPAWYGGKITGPNSNGFWNIFVFVKA